MTVLRILPAALLAALPMAAHADDSDATTYTLDNGRMTYELFEAAVPHGDLSRCPEGYDPEKQFCRLAINGDDLVIYVFEFDGDLPLVAIQTYNVEDSFPHF